MSTHINHTPGTASGGYFELSPKEFRSMADMVVVVLKAPHAGDCFPKHARVVMAGDAREAWDAARSLAPGLPVGLVCPDGECSGRLATRLAREGHTVYHLSGGLREWYHCCGRGRLPA